MARRLARFVVAAVAVIAAARAPAAGAATSQAPQRVVSLNLCTDQLLILLARRSRIAAVTYLATAHESSALAAQAEGLPAVRGSAEEVLALRPDLVLAGTYTTRHTTRMLRAFGIQVLTLPGAENFDEVRRQIRAVAGALHEEARGEEVIRLLDSKLAALPSLETRRAAFYQHGGYSAGWGTLQDAVLTTARMQNAAVAAGMRGYGYMPLERLLFERPEWLITTDYKRDVPTVGARVFRHPALQWLPGGEFVLPGKLIVCGGVWNADAAALLSHLGTKK